MTIPVKSIPKGTPCIVICLKEVHVDRDDILFAEETRTTHDIRFSEISVVYEINPEDAWAAVIRTRIYTNHVFVPYIMVSTIYEQGAKYDGEDWFLLISPDVYDSLTLP